MQLELNFELVGKLALLMVRVKSLNREPFFKFGHAGDIAGHTFNFAQKSVLTTLQLNGLRDDIFRAANQFQPRRFKTLVRSVESSPVVGRSRLCRTWSFLPSST